MNIETDTVPETADPEDQAILEALDVFASGDASSAGTADEALRRLYVEVLGLLPAGLEPEIPEERVWLRLAAELQFPPALGGAAASAAEERAPVASMASMAPVIPIASHLPAAAVPSAEPSAPARSETVPFALAGTRTAMRRHSRWPLALAATLAFALAGLSLYLLRNLDEQSEQVASLYVKLAAAEREASDLRQARGKLADIEEKYSLVTDPAGSIARLAPVASVTEQFQPKAHGLLFVAADHNHWVLCLDGLPPAEAGKGYQLWFMGESAAVSGGTFTAQPGEMVELSAESMPEGTKAVLITLEPAAGSPLPSGPKVLATVG